MLRVTKKSSLIHEPLHVTIMTVIWNPLNDMKQPHHVCMTKMHIEMNKNNSTFIHLIKATFIKIITNSSPLPVRLFNYSIL